MNRRSFIARLALAAASTTAAARLAMESALGAPAKPITSPPENLDYLYCTLIRDEAPAHHYSHGRPIFKCQLPQGVTHPGFVSPTHL